MRLDEDKLEALRRWGQALREADSEERAATGRAILMLLEEVDRLRLELLRTREQWRLDDSGSTEFAKDMGGELASTLHERLQPPPGSEQELVAGSDTGWERVTTSPKAWIESLRRQE
jgi:hypothetical protein